MKILYLASSADFHVDLWVKYFKENNKVFLFSDSQNYLQDQRFQNVKLIKSVGLFGQFLNKLNSKNKKLYQLNKLLSVKIFSSQIDEVVKKYKINIIHAHSLYFGYLNYFIKSNIPRIFTPMGSDVIIHAQGNVIYKHMARKAFAGSEIVTNDSSILQKKGFLVGASRKENYVIQNGVDSNIFYPKKNNLKRKYNLGNNDILLFSPRALEPLYNIDIVIKAIKNLTSKNFSIKCIFTYAFGNEYFDKLKKISKELNLENNLIWLGFKNYNEMAKLYNASDIVISIPNSDSSPKSVYEAMFCKKPVIVSDLEWSNEFFEREKNIFKVNSISPDELTNKILEIISNPKKAKIITESAYKIVKKNFDYRLNMRRLEKIMEESIKNSQNH